MDIIVARATLGATATTLNYTFQSPKEAVAARGGRIDKALQEFLAQLIAH